MSEPLFPIRPMVNQMPTGKLVLEPYRQGEAWLFDDPAVGLFREPFVGDTNLMIDRLAAAIPDAKNGFRLIVSHEPLEGQQAVLDWARADPVEGNWYRARDTGEEGWLCPSLFCYFPEAPKNLYVRAEMKVVQKPLGRSGDAPVVNQ